MPSDFIFLSLLLWDFDHQPGFDCGGQHRLKTNPGRGGGGDVGRGGEEGEGDGRDFAGIWGREGGAFLAVFFFSGEKPVFGRLTEGFNPH